MKKINKFSLLFGLILVMTILPMVSALATANVTMATPVASGTLSGSAAVFNCSLDAGFEGENWTSVRVSFQSAALTGNTTETTFTSWITNTTTYDLNGTVDTTVVEDGNDYTFKCQVFNGTNYVNATRTGITIDNTIPQTPSSLSPAASSVDTDGDITFSGTVTGANTTSCTLFFDGANPGSTSYSMTHTGNTCTYAATGIPEQTYSYYIRASDETNTTDSATTQIQVDKKTSSGNAALLAEQNNLQSEGGAEFSVVDSTLGGIPIWVIALIVVLLVIGIIKYKK